MHSAGGLTPIVMDLDSPAAARHAYPTDCRTRVRSGAPTIACGATAGILWNDIRKRCPNCASSCHREVQHCIRRGGDMRRGCRRAAV
jgi:hypothetical protein